MTDGATTPLHKHLSSKKHGITKNVHEENANSGSLGLSRQLTLVESSARAFSQVGFKESLFNPNLY